MPLDTTRLEKVKQKYGSISARCPACAEMGKDRDGDNLEVWPDGAFCCIVYPGDKSHNRRVLELAGGATPRNLPRMPERPTRPPLDCHDMLAQWAGETSQVALQTLAGGLGVSIPSLVSLGAVWASRHAAWAFPMRDGLNNIVGVRLRAEDGRKWSVRGSRNALFIPQVLTSSKVAYVTEGPTDTAAALAVGLFAIGRPSCHLGGPELNAALQRLGIRKAVIVADNDAPGIAGAERVASEVGVPTAIYLPQAKDLREFVRLGGTQLMIESDLKNVLWRRR